MITRTEELGPSGLASALVAAGALESDWLDAFKAVPRDLFVPDRIWPGIPDGTRQTPLVDRDSDPHAWFAAVYSDLPGAFWSVERYDDGGYTLWTYSKDTKSWASADYEPDAREFEVVQSGPRKLWDETEAAYRWWAEQGRPGFDRFGLTVGPRSQTAWLDRASNPVSG
ncbi:hypothetical protein J7E93_14510 [Streptomyces sp. ISL-36]|uniref:hypothetical protein n=1 Tax=Streptomyces sp. ISL-36 TaxID=2819182 RepID=UPI001BE6050F|nr:hypothetical protein [Streptomyces sp. ISL-36]MBT2441301.1 hypothetical protein [Streptomyces sp. ISL-36]